MNEYEMACEVRKRIEQFGRIIDGVYIFNMGGKFGTVKNYQQDEEHWEVLFDNLTHEQVIEVFEGAGTCTLINAADDLGSGTSSCMCFECGYTALDDWWEEFNFCPNCGRRIEGGK